MPEKQQIELIQEGLPILTKNPIRLNLTHTHILHQYLQDSYTIL